MQSRRLQPAKTPVSQGDNFKAGTEDRENPRFGFDLIGAPLARRIGKASSTGSWLGPLAIKLLTFASKGLLLSGSTWFLS